MFTNEEAKNLIELPKKILENDSLKDRIEIKQTFPLQKRFILITEQNDDFEFLLDIYQSKKVSLKLSLHNQENNSKIGLVRIDFRGEHRNPESITDTLPTKFHFVKGALFPFDQPHIHYYVEGYKNLAWALPLSKDDFPIKNIMNNSDIVDAILSFKEKINLTTKMDFEEALI